jgi:ubiquinone/menaquinone biosynthesis C-methylase UbiE
VTVGAPTAARNDAGREAANANAAMAASWNGPEGDNWVQHAEQFDQSVQHHHRLLVGAAEIAATDAVLDVGCGNGETTCDAATRAMSGGALGIDLSSQMIRNAADRARLAGLTNATFEVGDAQTHSFDDSAFDVVISRFGLMFFADPLEALTGLRRALRPGGRLVGIAWRAAEHNQWIETILDALALGRDLPRPVAGTPGPFGLADADRTRQWLHDAGFRHVDLARHDVPFRFGNDVDHALRWVSSFGVVRGLTSDLSDYHRAAAVHEVRRSLDELATDEGVSAMSSAWVIVAS